jgi:DNA-binding transcriptional MerR regulator
MADDPQNQPATTTTTPPAPTAAPPAAPARPAPKPDPSANISDKSFIKRVRHEAERMMMKETGLPIAEVKRILAERAKPAAAGGTTAPAAGGGGGGQTDVEAARARAKLEAVQKQNQQLQNEKAEAKRKLEREVRKLSDQIIEKDLTIMARDKGVGDPGYAVYLFIQAQAAATEQIDPVVFFDGLKTSHPNLFGQGSVRQVPATTAPPASSAPGGAPPPAANSTGQPPALVDADKMSPEDFQKHVAASSGWTPPRGY